MKKKLIIGMVLGASICLNTSGVFAKEVYKAQVTKTDQEARLEALFSSKKYDKAIELAEQLIKKDLKNVKARRILGDIYNDKYKLMSAYKQYKKVLEIDYKNSDALNGMGLIFYRKTASSDMKVRNNIDKYYERAIINFEKAIKYNPKHYKAYTNAGITLSEIGDMDKAESYFKNALKINPKYSKAIDGLGQVAFKKGEVDIAIKKYVEALKADKNNSTAYYHMGEALVFKGEYSRAIKYLNIALYKQPNSAPAQNMIGKAYKEQGNTVAAISAFKKAQLIKPEYEDSYLNIANIYEKRGDRDAAIVELKNAVMLKPEFAEGKMRIAELALKNKDTEQAIKYFNEVSELSECRKDALKGLANAYFVRAKENENSLLGSYADYHEVEASLNKALEYSPEDLELHLALIRLSKLTGSEIKSSVEKLEDNSSLTPIDLITKGEACVALSQYNNANREFRKAIRAVNSAREKLFIGEILLENGHKNSAAVAFNEALSIEPKSTLAKTYLSKIKQDKAKARNVLALAKDFQNKNNARAAIEHFKRSLDLDPSLKEAHIKLAKMFEKRDYFFNALEHYKAYHGMLEDEKEIKKIAKKVRRNEKRVEKIKRKGKNFNYYELI